MNQPFTLYAPVPPAHVTIGFQMDMKNVARALRASLAAMVASVGLDPQDPQALARSWGVNRKLTWKIAKVVQTEDAFLSLQHLPGSEGVEILLKKGKAAGVEPRFVEATKQAVEQFERMVEVHCGDRATFEIMGSGMSPAGAARQQEESNRKQFFQGASSIWGAQARVNLKLRFVAPSAGASARADKVDMVTVSGMIDFRRLRQNCPWIMTSRGGTHDDGAPIALPGVEPIDPRSTGELVPLMPDFCSRPLPTLNVLRDETFAAVELAPVQVGNAGVLTCVFGGIEREMPHLWTERDRQYGHLCLSNVPTELLIFDLFVHESVSYAIPPTLTLSSLLGPVARGGIEHERYPLPLHEPLLDLGAALLPPVTPEVPRYTEVIDTVFAKMRWSPHEFHVFRVKMAYPPIPAMLAMKYSLPE